MSTFGDPRALTHGRGDNDERLRSFEAKLEEYWQTLDSLFD
jgi:hypothetical protein